MDFLDIFLTLVYEEELRRNVVATFRRVVHRTRLFVVLLNRKIPKRDLVVCARSCEYRVFRGMPLDSSDGPMMPIESGNRRRVRRSRPEETCK